ncbi:MAG: hypothetical protein IKO11_01305 [Lachnospiraceae bacterium]|nr:hypothetical protein [Lachnospiraceae bacterium]
MKRFITFITGCALLLNSAAIPLHVSAGPEDNAAVSENNVSENSAENEKKRIVLHSAADLEDLAENCHDDAWSVDKEVVLESDIFLNSSDFTSIPIFNGHFDGQGHSITGYSYEGDGYVTAFFRYLEKDALVENLTVSAHIQAAGGQQVTGGIVGINNGTVSNCTFKGRIQGRSETAGIAGINLSDGNLFDCVNEGSIDGYYFTGGICGKNYGMIYGCKNLGDLNSSVEWVEADDAMSGNILDDLTGRDETKEARLQTGVDTGGIAGFSRGAVIRCSNEGTIGYEHTGYNIGGIIGRQSGTVSNCTNRGLVLGRKDVGGIVGQMEPYIELTDKDTVSSDVEELHGMVNDLLTMMDEDNAAVRADLQTLRSQADTTVAVGDRMADQAGNYMNSNMEVINEASRRMSYVLNEMPNVTGNVGDAGDSANDTVDKLRKANDDLDAKARMTEAERARVEFLTNEIDQLSAELKELQTPRKTASGGLWVHSADDSGVLPAYIEGSEGYSEVTADEGWFELQDKSHYLLHGEAWVTLSKDFPGITVSGNDISGTAVKDLPGNAEADEYGYYPVTTNRQAELQRQSEITARLAADMAELTTLYAPYAKEGATESSQDVREAMDALDSASQSANQAQDALESINAYLNAQPDLAMVKVDAEWENNMDTIHRQLDAMSGTMANLGAHSSEYTAEVNDQLRAINDKMDAIYKKVETKVDSLTGKADESIYADISDAELDEITLGRVSGSTNYGVIRGDINIGGISGFMAIDEEDPEENAAGTANVNLSGRYTTQNVLVNCINRGYITAKTDGAGGIVGFMRNGVIVKSCGYGYVESTDGNYVGGIAGESLSTIRDCYVLCSLSGHDYVGGIAGFGSTISGCYSMPMVQSYESRCGAIAGQIRINEDTREPELSELNGNHYVSEQLYGIDQISYLDRAARITYQQLLRSPGTPAEFRYLTVSFRVGDKYLGAKQVNYGDPVSSIEYPEIPAKEGFYGVWPELPWDTVCGNLVITAEYVDSVRVLESDAADELSGKKLALIDREFDNKATLTVRPVGTPSFEEAGYLAHLCYEVNVDSFVSDGTDSFPLRLYEPYGEENVELWQYAGGKWVKAESLKRGSYLQVEMQGSHAIYCIACPKTDWKLYVIIGGGIIALLFVISLIRRLHRRVAGKK